MSIILGERDAVVLNFVQETAPACGIGHQNTLTIANLSWIDVFIRCGIFEHGMNMHAPLVRKG